MEIKGKMAVIVKVLISQAAGKVRERENPGAA
jgi:hypothetical protein